MCLNYNILKYFAESEGVDLSLSALLNRKISNKPPLPTPCFWEKTRIARSRFFRICLLKKKYRIPSSYRSRNCHAYCRTVMVSQFHHFIISLAGIAEPACQTGHGKPVYKKVY